MANAGTAFLSRTAPCLNLQQGGYMAKTDVERLAKLVRDRDSFLSTHKALMEAFKASKTPRLKEMASQALEEAGKRDDRIAQIIGEHKKDAKNSD
jgi:hypothetical protein